MRLRDAHGHELHIVPPPLARLVGQRVRYSAEVATIELWLFTINDPLMGKRRRTTYRLTIDEARERYVDPEPVQWSLERREVNERERGHGQTLGAPTTIVLSSRRTSSTT